MGANTPFLCEVIVLVEEVRKFIGFKCDLTIDRADEEREIVAKVIEAANGCAIIKQPGKPSELIRADHILECDRVAKPVDTTVKIRYLQAPKSYRAHLADRHGFTLAEAQLLTEEEAKQAHEAINHDALSHRHGQKPPAPRGRKPRQHFEVLADVDADEVIKAQQEAKPRPEDSKIGLLFLSA